MRDRTAAGCAERRARAAECDEEVVIIGAGPAGVAAAVQLKRSGRDPLVIERGEPGGLVRNAWLVENYPGFPDGVPGPELARLIADGLGKWEVRIAREEVTRLDLARSSEDFAVETTSRARTSQAVIVASGTDPLEFDVQGLSAVPSDRFHREVHGLRDLDGASIAIIGGGDAAFDHALSLGERNLVFILNRSYHARALGLLEEHAGSSESIRRLDSTRVASLKWDGRSVIVRTEGACPMEYVVDHVVAAVGRRPATSFIAPQVLSARAELEAKGLFYMVGDVAHGSCRQVGVAVGDGIAAAMAVHRALPGGSK